MVTVLIEKLTLLLLRTDDTDIHGVALVEVRQLGAPVLDYLY
jgi:hypothetical protein